MTKKLTFNLGLENQINDIRNGFDLTKINLNLVNTLDYIAFVNPVELLKLSKSNYYNSEDELFMVVHQVSECWFNIGINELTSIKNLMKEENIDVVKCENHFKAIYDVLEYVSTHVLLLEHMILADYHP